MQLSIDFEPTLLRQFPEFQDCVRASVYSCGRPFKHIAADLDMSVSELSRKLAENPNDPVHFPLKKLPMLMQATGDVRPLLWLAAHFLPNDQQRRALVLAQSERLIGELVQLLGQVKSDDVTGTADN